MPGTKIAALGYYVPENIITNHDLAQRMDTSDEWIRERSGIIERRYFTPGKDTVSNMGANAARMAAERAGISVEDIDFIIFATLNPDYMFPGSGVLLQRDLGIAEKGIPALDIRNQCSGFIYGLSIADQFIKTGMYKNVLLVGSEIHSSGLDFSDEGRDVTVLFGDGRVLLFYSLPMKKERVYSPPIYMPTVHMPSDWLYWHPVVISSATLPMR